MKKMIKRLKLIRREKEIYLKLVIFYAEKVFTSGTLDQNFELPEPVLTVQPSGVDEGPGDFGLLQDPLVLLHALNSSK